MREQVIKVEPQKVITRDNVTVTVDAVIYYRVADPVRAMFEVQNFGLAATTLAQTNLRNLIGDKSLDETLIARDMINTNLRAVLDEATNAWGVKVTRVEVQKIDPPSDITEAMSRQMKAERDKRASILESEGVRQSEILKAEGFKQAEILKAEGDAQARLTRATRGGEGAIEMVSNAAEKFFHDRAALSRQLDVLETTLKDNTKFILPGNADLVTVLGLGSRTRRRRSCRCDANRARALPGRRARDRVELTACTSRNADDGAAARTRLGRGLAGRARIVRLGRARGVQPPDRVVHCRIRHCAGR